MDIHIKDYVVFEILVVVLETKKSIWKLFDGGGAGNRQIEFECRESVNRSTI